LAAAIDSVEATIRQVVPFASRVYLEPDVWRADHVPIPDGPAMSEERHH
jgi:hypothetical protein